MPTLPRQPGKPVCGEFKKTGSCSKYLPGGSGKCAFDHPPEIAEDMRINRAGFGKDEPKPIASPSSAKPLQPRGRMTRETVRERADTEECLPEELNMIESQIAPENNSNDRAQPKASQSENFSMGAIRKEIFSIRESLEYLVKAEVEKVMASITTTRSDSEEHYKQLNSEKEELLLLIRQNQKETANIRIAYDVSKGDVENLKAALKDCQMEAKMLQAGTRSDMEQTMASLDADQSRRIEALEKCCEAQEKRLAQQEIDIKTLRTDSEKSQEDHNHALKKLKELACGNIEGLQTACTELQSVMKAVKTQLEEHTENVNTKFGSYEETGEKSRRQYTKFNETLADTMRQFQDLESKTKEMMKQGAAARAEGQIMSENVKTQLNTALQKVAKASADAETSNAEIDRMQARLDAALAKQEGSVTKYFLKLDTQTLEAVEMARAATTEVGHIQNSIVPKLQEHLEKSVSRVEAMAGKATNGLSSVQTTVGILQEGSESTNKELREAVLQVKQDVADTTTKLNIITKTASDGDFYREKLEVSQKGFNMQIADLQKQLDEAHTQLSGDARYTKLNDLYQKQNNEVADLQRTIIALKREQKGLQEKVANLN